MATLHTGVGGPARRFAVIDRYFEVSLYLLIFTGFATLVTTGRLDALTVALVTAALLVRGALLLRGRNVQIPERWTTYLTLVYVPVYIADFLILSGSFVAATVHLVLFSMVMKVFSVQRDRDHVYLAILAFLEVLGAAVLTVDSVFLGAFCLFMMLAVATFISMEMRRSAAAALHAAALPATIRPVQRTPRRGGLRIRQLPAALSATSVVLMLCIFGGSAVLFFLLPRVSAGYMGAFAPRNELVSGFAQDVNLGQIGVIQQSNTVVMHISAQAGPADLSALKWRGVALDKFDGKRWSGTNIAPTYLPRGPEGRFNLARLRTLDTHAAGPHGGRALQYRVLMEPVGLSVFFLTPRAEILFGNYRVISMDANGSFYNEDRDRQISAYDAVSTLAEPPGEQLRAASTSYSPTVEMQYLQLPRVDERVRQLAQEVTAGAPSPYEKALALERYLSTQFGYSLQLPSTPPEDPIAHFLFVRKQGHCEYFASAMAVMLRTLGIPSRIVNGFRTGEYNDVTGSYIIRAREAHAWVEVFFPGYGWVDFDPTPAAVRPQPSGWTRALLYVDAMREFWREWVINYDFAHQRNLTSDTVSRGRRLVENGRSWVRRQYQEMLQQAHRMRLQVLRAPQKWGGGTMAVLGAVLLGLGIRPAARLWRRRRMIAAPGRAPRAAAGLWYEKMTRALARRGWRKRPAQSPGEFVAAIADAELRRRVASFTSSYERARFGGSAEDAEKLPEQYREMVETR